MMGLLTHALHAVVDTAFVGRLGTAPLAALGIANIFYFTGVVLWLGLMRNSIAFTARAFGAGRRERIGEILAHYQWLALSALPILWGLSLAFPYVAGLAGLPPAVTEFGMIYLAIRVFDVPFLLTQILYGSFYQSIGNSRFPMIVSWGALLLNVVLDYGLIFGHFGLPALGVAGSALATLIAAAAGAAVIVGASHLGPSRGIYRLRLLMWPRWQMLRNILAVGVPQGLGDLVEIGAFLVFFTIVGRLGEVSLAANNIGIQVTHLMFMPGAAAGIAAASYVGRFLGRGDPAAARGAAYRTAAIGIAYMGAMGLPLWFFGAAIARIFSVDPAVIALAVPLFKLMAIYQAFDGLGLIMRGALNGAGDTRFPVAVSLVCALGIMFPGAIWFSTRVEPGLLGAWLGAAGYIVVYGLIVLYRFRRGRWATIRLAAAEHTTGQ